MKGHDCDKESEENNRLKDVDFVTSNTLDN